MKQQFNEHGDESIVVANVDLLELEPLGFRDRRQVLQISGAGELVHYADGVRSVVDDVPGYCRPDESGSAGDDDSIHFFISQC